MERRLKGGSLFDGEGGFLLAMERFAIEPIWASEIEAFPVAVTKYHFPQVTHLGDITKIDGSKIEPVDVITFGSPCQDMSVAGKRKGMGFECTECGEVWTYDTEVLLERCPRCTSTLIRSTRSGLFMEAIRIIREMRCATHEKYPSFAIWENVPGALSSNQGRDFRAVLEELTQSTISIPPSGKWGSAGMVRGRGFEVAWRILDAQYFGVPQRRKRIFLISDFTGNRAGEILFVEKSVPRNSTEG